MWIFKKLKNKSRGLQWENKSLKLERSILACAIVFWTTQSTSYLLYVLCLALITVIHCTFVTETIAAAVFYKNEGINF